MAILIVIIIVLVALFILNKKRHSKCAAAKSSGGAKKVMAGAPVVHDYNDYILNAGLEKSVVDSHRQFVNDIQRSTTGASAQTVLSGDVFDVPFVGLRRPNLEDVYVDPNSRMVPTAETWQMPKGNRYNKCGLY